MTLRVPSILLRIAVLFLFVLSLPGIADARGSGRAGGGGGGGGGDRSFSRSKPGQRR